MPEPIASSASGYQKEDCEISAAKCFITHLTKGHPRLGILITGDGLFSKAPMVNLVLELWRMIYREGGIVIPTKIRCR